jgi:hypothetical protein
MNRPLDLKALDEPDLLFAYGQRMTHPKDGLLIYGPQENPFGTGKLRVGLIGTEQGVARYGRYMRTLAQPIMPARPDDPNHTIFPGFQAVFGAEWPESAVVTLLVDAVALDRAIRMEDRHPQSCLTLLGSDH